MDCVNHSGVTAAAFCQSCGKPLCQACVRSGPAGQIFCEPCWMAWQGTQTPFVTPPPGVPSPGLAAVLGLIPGVGAMYNGQFIKGLVHVVIFAVLVSAAHVYGIFGLFIAGWVFYQVFEAYHTAKARRDGDPLPDPLGLNDIGSWFVAGGRGPFGHGSGVWRGNHSGPGRHVSAAGSKCESGSISIFVSGSLSGALSTSVSGAVRAACCRLHRPRRSSCSAGSTRSADSLAPPGTDWRHYFDRPGDFVSAGAIQLVFRADV